MFCVLDLCKCKRFNVNQMFFVVESIFCCSIVVLLVYGYLLTFDAQ